MSNLSKIRTLCVLALVALMMSCSRESEVPVPAKPVDGKGTETPPPPATGTTNLTTGVTAQKVKSPKQVTDFLRQLPATYNDNPNKKWPVIIFLHGVGERGNDINLVKRAGLAARAAQDPNFPFIVISPQCKASSWWDVPSLEVLYEQVVKEYKVDPSRIYLTGLSMGGYGTWSWALSKPDRFAAYVPICGEGTPSKACVLKDKPVWVFHNADDPTVPVKGSRDMVNAIRSCGGTLVKYTENATGGHNAWTKAYNDPALYTWLNQQKQ
ncbi:hypothetical protein ACQKLP_25410 [Chitinophaga sp. NPDC101104]|uniref:carboxylesterase family protein n=1 Tax=Chitinophaga sp. NPDC101104 TaxID=3390561 RepID=UPI003D063C74